MSSYSLMQSGAVSMLHSPWSQYTMSSPTRVNPLLQEYLNTDCLNSLTAFLWPLVIPGSLVGSQEPIARKKIIVTKI